MSSLTKNNKWADALVQLAFDQTFGAAIVNCGFMAIFVVLKTAVGGQSMAPAALYAAVSGKVGGMRIYELHLAVFLHTENGRAASIRPDKSGMASFLSPGGEVSGYDLNTDQGNKENNGDET